MPLFQEASQSQVPLLNDQNADQKIPLFAIMPRSIKSKPVVTNNSQRRWLGTAAILLFLIMAFTKIAIVSSGDIVSLSGRMVPTSNRSQYYPTMTERGPFYDAVDPDRIDDLDQERS